MLILQSLKYQSIVFTDRIKQGSQFDVSLLYSFREDAPRYDDGLTGDSISF